MNQSIQPVPPGLQPVPRRPVVIYYCAPVVHPATTKLRNTLCNAVNLAVPSVAIFMSSGGGLVEEGISLFAFIRSLPIDITIHNIDHVDSIALAIYLAGTRRLANPDATFLLHDFYFPQPISISTRHQASDLSVSLTASRQKMMAILRSRTKMSDEQFKSLRFLEETVIQTASTAKEIGITHEIEQAVAPMEAELFNIEY
jgi:ATP-dependent Clp protease, protease subunit